MKHTIKAILFDLDDTLWAIDPVIEEAEATLIGWLREHVPAVLENHSMDSFRRRQAELVKKQPEYGFRLGELRRRVLSEAFEKSGENPARADEAMQVFSRIRNRVRLYDDVLPALSRLGTAYALGSVSNGAADLLQIGIAHHFRVSIAASGFGRPKPDAAIFHAACDALELRPGAVLYVGDDPQNDVAGAQNAGLKTAWIQRPDLSPRQMPDRIRPDMRIASLEELERRLMP